MKDNRSFQMEGSVCPWASTMRTGRCKAFDICDLWYVGWAAGKRNQGMKDDLLQEKPWASCQGV